MEPVNVYAVVSPVILSLVAVEFAYCLWKRNGYYAFDDTLAAFATAIGHQVTNVFVAWAVYLGLRALHARFAWLDIAPTPVNWALLFLAVDFLFYWFHRVGHRVNVLWAAHAPHHSSEELNYAVAIRASVTQRAASFLFYWPLALVGFPAEMILPTVAVHLVLQFLPHTRVVRRLGLLEWVLNCPTHHRVHHAINPRYLDKNYGGTLIVWDRLFGTYAAEVEEPVYGVRPALRSWDPVRANLQFFIPLVRDAWRTRSTWDRLRLWLMPTGWRPRDLEPHPAHPPVEPETQVKYRTPVTPALRAYLLAQLPLALAVMLTITRDESRLGRGQMLLMGTLVWVAMISWGGLLEARAWAMRLELPKLLAFALAGVAVYAGGDWTSSVAHAWVLGPGALALAFVWLTGAGAVSRPATS